jgi:hypothetical protein
VHGFSVPTSFPALFSGRQAISIIKYKKTIGRRRPGYLANATLAAAAHASDASVDEGTARDAGCCSTMG